MGSFVEAKFVPHGFGCCSRVFSHFKAPILVEINIHRNSISSFISALLSAAIKPSLGSSDTQADMLSGIPKSAICVQKFDDSLNSAIHTTYRISLRSSSMHEPRDPPLKVVSWFNSF
jgi:hypothetical protein